jgi:RNA polymerase sigma-70 factor (ECF subfamily)
MEAVVGGGDMEPDDRTLLARHIAGDDTAFGTLFARHRDRLWAVALRTTGNPEDAEDAVQEAMIAAFRRAGSYRGEAAVTTWLHRIVVNASLDRIRRRAVRAADSLPDDLDVLPRQGAAAAQANAGDPELAAEAADRRSAVLTALTRLPAEQRAALVLVDMEGFSMGEAADILGVAVGTVKSRCSRGRARLMPLLAAYRPVFPEAEPARPESPGPGGNDLAGPRVRSSGARRPRPPSQEQARLEEGGSP